MLDALKELHDQIGRAIATLEPLAGVIEAWEGAQDAPGRAPAVAAPMSNGNGSSSPDEPAAPDAAPSEAVAPEPTPQQTCPGCNEQFTPKNSRQRFCTRPCGQRFWATARKGTRKAPGRARQRRGTPVQPATEAPAGAPPAREREALRNGLATGDDLGALPDDPERDFRVPVEDDPERAPYLKPPPLDWEGRAP